MPSGSTVAAAFRTSTHGGVPGARARNGSRAARSARCYGVALANLLLLPIAGKLRMLIQDQVTQREIIQAGVEMAGVPGPRGDAEIIAVAAATLEAIGFPEVTIDLEARPPIATCDGSRSRAVANAAIASSRS